NGKEANIAEVLDMTIAEAIEFFKENKEIVRNLEPLVKVGLDYLKLGQPIPTLSGGEAQRLKLAKHLADALKGESKHTLFIFDEPTTGLHFDDVFKLMKSLQELVQSGHSVLLVEHNLDVINASDWIIELGPEGGERGGRELFAGTPKDFRIKDTPTGLALAAYNKALKEKNPSAYFTDFKPQEEPKALSYPKDAITVVNAREHNLKNLSLQIPRNKFTVVTGVSGSGKSTLAFDLIFNEGQRRYLESLNAFARSMVQPAGAPDVDAIYGIPPTVAIEQRTSRGGQKSTVATMTEIYHFLRLLYVKLGTQYCPTCNVPVIKQSKDQIFASIMKTYKGKEITFLAPLVKNRKGFYKDLAVWARNKGYEHLIVDGEKVSTLRFPSLSRFTEHNIDLPTGTVKVTPENEGEIKQLVAVTLDFGKGILDIEQKGKKRTFSSTSNCPNCQKSFPELDPRLFSYNSKHGWCPTCMGNGFKPFQNALAVDENTGELTAEAMSEELVICPDCHGQRLNLVALNVRFNDKSIAEVAAMTIDQAADYFNTIELTGRQADIARDALQEIRSRLSFLKEVGLSYLNLDRSAPTLSGGEAQRIRLASQLGTNLQGVCYVLDEPTIGLHPRDNKILLSALEQLTSKGNSLLVVEHDEETIRSADHVIDIGPGAGTRGGQLIAQGSVEDIEASEKSLTGYYLKHPLQHTCKAKRRTLKSDPMITVQGANSHNLKDVTASFPLKRLTVLTGVSGSGKSTLAREVFLKNMAALVREKGKSVPTPEGCKGISGWETVDRILEVDQTPIGKTPRSCPATYIGFWDDIRKLFAQSEEAKARGYTASRFSFNVKGGRCEACEGQGIKTLEMSFLPDVKVHCDVCDSMRFNEETLEVKWKGKSIGEVLKMEVDEAVEFFASVPSILHPLKLMQDVGLGYLTLGQPSPTLSGGEAQRIKLVTELSKVKDDIRKGGRKLPETVYVLDEPTVGLHMADVDKLIKVLHRLVDAGNTVIVIEHNLDVIAEADWIIDMGPEGGSQGGKNVFAGPPQRLLRASTHTAEALKEFMETAKLKKTQSA
ncbi:MAG: excinuclease ABC subunit UvrA, partial [Parasutterella sp.]|nr:excinuclease ABC subunit UvrA [Parasutterella sp.]